MGQEASGLEVWVVYDHPSDFPDFYVARKQVALNDGKIYSTSSVLASPDLGAIRQTLTNMGLACIARSEGDDPVIVESWL